MVYCWQCGALLPENDNVCAKCGGRVNKASSNLGTAPDIFTNPDEVIAENKPEGIQQVSSMIPLIEGETILWHREITKGLIHKEVVMEEAVTNKRCLKYHVENRRMVAQLGLSHRPDVVVVNVHRVNDSVGGSVFLTRRILGIRGLGSLGVYGGPRRGNIKVFGDVSFMNEGKVVTTFENVQTPQGLRMLIESLKREYGFAGPRNLKPGLGRRLDKQRFGTNVQGFVV